MNNTSPYAPINLLISILSTIMAFITLHDAQTLLALVSAFIAILSGFFAARYYYYGSREKKLLIKKLKIELKIKDED